jgi:hypothetical protein
MKTPEKAESLARFCDKWFLAAPAGLVKEEELPRPWGLYELEGENLVLKKAAEKLSAEPLNRGLVASLLRALRRNLQSGENQRLDREQAVKRAKLLWKSEKEHEFNDLKFKYDFLLHNLDVVREKFGLDVLRPDTAWNYMIKVAEDYEKGELEKIKIECLKELRRKIEATMDRFEADLLEEGKGTAA